MGSLWSESFQVMMSITSRSYRDDGGDDNDNDYGDDGDDEDDNIYNNNNFFLQQFS